MTNISYINIIRLYFTVIIAIICIIIVYILYSLITRHGIKNVHRNQDIDMINK